MALRRLPALLVALLLAPVSPAAAATPATGGVATPEGTGGVEAGQPVVASGRRASAFAVSPGTLPATGGALTFTFRVDARSRRVRVQLALTASEAQRPAARLRLGTVRTGRSHRRVWHVPANRLAPGDYAVSLLAVDAAGRSLRAATAPPALALRVDPPPPAPEPPPPPAPVAAPPATSAGVFPVQGTWTLGYEDARFGAPRGSHAHQGQDIVAAEGTPVVAPQPGVVSKVAYQATGAGHYVVLRAGDGRDLVFMHLQAASIPVAAGASVAAGALLGRVGATGSATGPHLHFEIWPGGWWASPDSQP
ncbi:MAG TPA: M23 family metallopeptidase, partial [Solirubrobacteraceae bacterium]|nr:M23 family metallopeptidase [Solirubrobacteraceae bacterium]